jgi:hypothetical protein
MTPGVPSGGVKKRRGQHGEPKTAWIWMGAAFIVLATIAVIALLLILRFVGRVPPILSGPLPSASVIGATVMLDRGSPRWDAS